MNKIFDLTDKNILITGGGGFLALDFAKAILSANGNVILCDISNELLLIAKKKLMMEFPEGRVSIFLMDVTNEQNVLDIANEIELQMNSIDVLINNAAINPKHDENSQLSNASRVENFDLNLWDFEINVGLKGAFICSRVFGMSMIKYKKSGIIINIASDLSVIAPNQNLYKKKEINEDNQSVKPVTYSIVKSGLIGLTKYFATYWADRLIRVNAISPGGMFNNQPKDFLNKIEELIPMKRMGLPHELRGILIFLCSDASSYITGQNILVDGGRSVW
jgi:NAD(P)-dependent dehydrogenase (short-subunit alcohol dehydrogenase family)